MAINCAALPTDLLESELFGHEVGAFPGAARARYGKFEHARGGTIFFDEIDRLTQPMQAKTVKSPGWARTIQFRKTSDLSPRPNMTSKQRLRAVNSEATFFIA